MNSHSSFRTPGRLHLTVALVPRGPGALPPLPLDSAAQAGRPEAEAWRAGSRQAPTFVMDRLTLPRARDHTMPKAIKSKAAAVETRRVSADAAAAANGTDNARAANTTASYRSAWAAWQAWADDNGASALPASPAAVAAYLAHRATAGAKLSTVRVAKAAIAAAHREAGADNPCASPLVTKAVRDLARAAAAAGNAAPRQAAALTAEALAAIRATATKPRPGRGGRLETADNATRRGLVDIALCTVMADGGLRRSEAAALVWRDVARAGDGSGRVTIRQPKADGEGADAVVAITARAMADLDAIRGGAGDDAPVFGLSPDQVYRRLKEAARAAGLGDGFSGHSGVVGMARRMTSNGAPTAVTMNQGRWKSPRMVARYTRDEAAGAALPYLC